jgi:hypothetical protein
MSEQARQDALHARIDSHTDHTQGCDLAGYFHLEVSGQSNPEAYLRNMVSDISKDVELNTLLNALDSRKIAHDNARAQAIADKPMEDLRVERDKALLSTDHTQLADAPLGSTEKADYRDYRQYLRDLPTLIANSQANMEVLSFDAWKANPPVY